MTAQQNSYSRRQIAYGAAWLAPAVAISAAAPAFAASPCRSVFNYKYGSSSTVSPITVGSSDAESVTMTFASTMNGGTATSYNFTVGNKANNSATSVVSVGNTTERGLILNQYGAGASQTVTITFSQAVRNVSIYVRDITWRSNSDRDAVAFSIAPSQIENVTNSSVSLTGAGTLASPSMRSGTGANNGTSGTYYDARYRFDEALTNISLTYSNALSTASGYQYIELPEFTFCI